MIEREYFPDGTKIDEWFYDYDIPRLEDLGKSYDITDYGAKDDGKIYTENIQNAIDKAAREGGGVVVIPKGTYLTGALFFKQGVNLYLTEGAVLKGSDFVTDYPVLNTRIEGQNCKYFSALINADGVDGFTIAGKGTIDGNGERAWAAFWIRRKWNPDCTNKDEQRPRLIYISNSKNVTIAECTFTRSHFWTTHIYRCNHVRYIGCTITSERGKAPSTDAIDIDVCSDVLVKNCYVSVNDDGVVLKGGKGPNANILPENGANERIIIEDCEFGYCHGCLTCGSESVHDKNILLRRINVKGTTRLLWFKLRPDTPQNYEYLRAEKVVGNVDYMLMAKPWTQFFDMKGAEKVPASKVRFVTIKDCDLVCKNYFAVEPSEQYVLSDFEFVNLNIETEVDDFKEGVIENLKKTKTSVKLTKEI